MVASLSRNLTTEHSVSSGGCSEPWLLVSGGFHRHGGMDLANLALAEYLRRSGHGVTLLGHDFDPDIAPEMAKIRIPRLLGSTVLGEIALRIAGKRKAEILIGENYRTRVVVNGSNCTYADVNWVHYVHGAWVPTYAGAPVWVRAWHALQRNIYCRRETEGLRRAQLVIANSKICAQQVITKIGVPADRVKVVHLGCSPDLEPPSAEERDAARRWLGVREDQRIVAFIGALGWDERKGFDTLWHAWQTNFEPGIVLVVAGAGGKLKYWQSQVQKHGSNNVRMLGFTRRVKDLLAAADLLVSPSRYDTFGLNVQEAICRGVPSISSRCAGIAELFPESMHGLILENPDCPEELAHLMHCTFADLNSWKTRTLEFGKHLRAYTWDDMSRRIVELAGENS